LATTGHDGGIALPERRSRYNAPFTRLACMTVDAQNQYRIASALHHRGQLDEARDAYLQLLKDYPDHARALHRLGNLDLRGGRIADAERLIRRAIELQPEGTGFHNSLGNVLWAAGRVEDAFDAYAEELRQRPDFAVAHHQIGLLHLQQGRPQEALKSVQKSIYHAPEFPGGYNTLGRIYNNLGQLQEAEQALRRARHFDPSNAEISFNLGHVAQRQGKFDEALRDFEAAIKLVPDMQRAHRSLGMLLLTNGHPEKAIDHFEQALTLDPADPYSHFGLGVIFQDRAILAPAKRHFTEAIRHAPDYADAHCNLGAIHRSSGEFEAAKAHFAKALETEPDHIPALSGLAAVLEMEGAYEEAYDLLHQRVSRGEAHADVLVVYATILERLDRRDEAIATLKQDIPNRHHGEFDRMVLHFKLGDLLDHADRYDEAIEHFETGNSLRQTDFSPENCHQVANRIVAVYGATSMKSLPRSNCDSDRPLFIVGMPRSGTSLVEQILASHPAVHGAGELATIGLQALGLQQTLNSTAAYPECVEDLNSTTLDSLAALYLDQLDRLAPQALRVTDKMWQNYENLGLIALMFPQARVVHCVREPRDTLLSCYFHLFGAGGIPFSYDPSHLIAAWEAYRQLMLHWRKACPLPMLEIDYEELAQEPAVQIPRLIEFAGLPWDEACLDFHQTRRAVTTASYHQVTQPMYTRSIGRYRNYQTWTDTHLGKLRKF